MNKIVKSNNKDNILVQVFDLAVEMMSASYPELSGSSSISSTPNPAAC